MASSEDIIATIAATDASYEIELERIAFGSCHSRGAFNKRLTSKDNGDAPTIFDTISSTVQPQTFLWTGDSIYPPKGLHGDMPLSIMQIEYDEMRHNTTLGYAKFRDDSKNMLIGGIHGTWDDHDYGGNDRGYELKEREERRDMYLDFLDVPKESARYKRQGVYSSIEFAKDNNRTVKVIFLDTRWHREKHCIPSVGSTKMPFGALVACLTRWLTAGLYLPSTILCSDDNLMLGEEQWEWFEQQLKDSSASMHIVVSSIQVLTTNPVVESWGHFPKERERLLRLISSVNGLVILSGDVHHAEISAATKKNRQLDDEVATDNLAANNGAFVEITSSGLTHSCSEPFYGPLCKQILDGFSTNRLIGGNTKEKSLPSYYTSRNFGSINIDWASKSYNVNVHDADGNVVLSSGFDMSSITGMSNDDIHAIPGCIDGHFLPYMRDVASFYLAGLLIFCLYYFFLRETDDTSHDNGANTKSKKD